MTSAGECTNIRFWLLVVRAVITDVLIGEEFLYCVKAAGFASGSAASGRACGLRPVPPCTAPHGNDIAPPHPISAHTFEPPNRRRSARGEWSAHRVRAWTGQSGRA